MSTLEAIVLGIVQGLTEFLPISSTGHLRIVPALLGWDDPGRRVHRGDPARDDGGGAHLLPRATSGGSRAAWLRELRDADPRSARHDARLGWFIILGTIPIAIFGFAFKDQIETGARNLYLIGAALILFAFVMLARRARRHATRASSTTMTAATASSSASRRRSRWSPASRARARRSPPACSAASTASAAARYSFLLSVPAVVLSGLFELRKIGEAGGAAGRRDGDRDASSPSSSATPRSPGCCATSPPTRCAIFVVYRVALGALVLALAASGAIH